MNIKALGVKGLDIEEQRMLYRIAQRCYSRYLSHYMQGTVSLEDLIHQGLIGLLQARQSYDESADVPFVLFAEPRVYGAIMDWIRNLPLIRVPQKKWKEVQKLQKAESTLLKKDRSVNTSALAKFLGWTPKKVDTIRQMIPQVLSIDVNREDRDNKEPFQLVYPGGSQTPEKACLKKELAKELHKAVNYCLETSLDPDSRHILLSRILYKTTLRELAKLYGHSIEWVRRQQVKATDKMRKCLEKMGCKLEEYNAFG
ncbi:MAG: sigma-70 family RNA polymerase sigma factor [Deltaproteobacteria bacterium]|nr:sigma-70 family RNA polymerase sigma factor [Deltaproteobacteria bacterium]MDL1961530.1 sigma-70 family RNA polymerase sigma factor [Deltaproteobacteria bacterium]